MCWDELQLEDKNREIMLERWNHQSSEEISMSGKELLGCLSFQKDTIRLCTAESILSCLYVYISPNLIYTKACLHLPEKYKKALV